MGKVLKAISHKEANDLKKFGRHFWIQLEQSHQIKTFGFSISHFFTYPYALMPIYIRKILKQSVVLKPKKNWEMVAGQAGRYLVGCNGTVWLLLHHVVWQCEDSRLPGLPQFDGQADYLSSFFLEAPVPADTVALLQMAGTNSHAGPSDWHI